MKFPRETATHIEDLPHRFDDVAGEHLCDVCGWKAEDARHLAWEQDQILQREHAGQALSGSVTRQFG